MSLLTLPPSRAPMVGANGLVSSDWYRFFHDLSLRAGGVDGLSTNDVDAGSFAAMQPAVNSADFLQQVLQPGAGASSDADLMQSSACCASEIYPMQG